MRHRDKLELWTVNLLKFFSLFLSVITGLGLILLIISSFSWGIGSLISAIPFLIGCVTFSYVACMLE